MKLVEGLTIAGRFRLIRELGRGGMGSVWLAQHTTLDSLCAVKFIDRERHNSAEVRARFEQEAKAAAQLRSPNVVQILDFGVSGGMPYLAMEYLEGEDLGQRLEREWSLNPAETFRIISQVARALSKAHSAGVVHRDLKPENVFLVRDVDGEIVKVLDFGIAKRANTNIAEAGTQTGALLGTPFYMSPEQARGNRTVDHRSDLWSLAVITYQCMTGALPFASEGLGDLLSQIMHEPLPVPSRIAAVPPEFDAWWEKAAARDPNYRFQTAKELVDGLSQALGVFDAIPVTEIAPSSEILVSSQGAAERAAFREAVTVYNAPTDEPLSRTFGIEPPARRGRRAARWVMGGALVLTALGFGWAKTEGWLDRGVHLQSAPAGVEPARAAATEGWAERRPAPSAAAPAAPPVAPEGDAGSAQASAPNPAEPAALTGKRDPAAAKKTTTSGTRSKAARPKRTHATTPKTKKAPSTRSKTEPAPKATSKRVDFGI